MIIQSHLKHLEHSLTNLKIMCVLVRENLGGTATVDVLT